MSRTRLGRLAVAAVMTATAVVGAVVTAAAPAQAGIGGCGGSEVTGSPYPVKLNNGTVLGQVHLYWDGQTNCAVTVKQGRVYNVATQTEVFIGSCYWGCSYLVDSKEDSKVYKYYAGPVRVAGGGLCVKAYGRIADLDGTMAYWYSPDEGFHC